LAVREQAAQAEAGALEILAGLRRGENEAADTWLSVAIIVAIDVFQRGAARRSANW
jgi:hypothetical protein